MTKINHDCESCKAWSEYCRKGSEDYKDESEVYKRWMRESEKYAKRCLCGGKEKEARQ